MQKCQDFRPARSRMQLPVLRTYSALFPENIPLETEFEDASAASILTASLEITPIENNSTLSYLPDWKPIAFDDKPDGAHRFEVVDVFGASYFVRPSYLALLEFLDNIERDKTGYVIITGQPGSGISSCGYVVFAKLLIRQMLKIDKDQPNRLFVFVNNSGECFIYFWADMWLYRLKANSLKHRVNRLYILKNGQWIPTSGSHVCPVDGDVETIIESLKEPSYIFSDTTKISPNLINVRTLITVSPEKAPHKLCIDDSESITARYICLPPWPLHHLALTFHVMRRNTQEPLDLEGIIAKFHGYGRSPRDLFGVPERTEWKELMNEAMESFKKGTARDILVESFDRYLKNDWSLKLLSIIPVTSIRDQLNEPQRSQMEPKVHFVLRSVEAYERFVDVAVQSNEDVEFNK